MIAVGGIGHSNDFVSWTGGTTGPELDFVAPAEQLVGEYLNGTLAGANGEGTSQATALVSGTFVLLRSKFPHESARQIVTRALWNVHNGLGGKVFAQRIDDNLGYGEVLPVFALTTAPPAGAANPIYDKIEAHLRAASASARPPTSSPPPSEAATKGDSGSGGPLPAILIGLGAVALIGTVVLVIRASRRRPQQHGAPPPGQW